MSAKVRPIRGMNDVLPPDTGRWQHLEDTVRDVLESYGYRQMRLPLLEYTELFRRSIGEVTDIVEKEMYTFEDRNGDSLTLRPEATAGVVRAAISNGLLHNQRHRLWTAGPMFRYERPQKGRYRQFHQIDVEALGYPGPDIDAEMILMSARLWRRLGIRRIRLEINSLGTPASRQHYREVLVEYFRAHRDRLDEDSIRRLDTNPMRILDSKNADMQDVVAGAPDITEHLDEESAAHFAELQRILSAAGVDYTVNPRLVRGLDYYTRTVFEWVTDALGAQGAVCSGGRYDGLVEHLGGAPTPAIGWALGMERLVALFEEEGGAEPDGAPAVYVVAVGDTAAATAFALAERLRDGLPGQAVEVNAGGGSFKSQLKRADRSGARYAVVLGENEIAAGEAGLKPLRTDEAQQSVAFDELAAVLARRLDGGGTRQGQKV
ncbi:histidine--tRNA ligase [Lentisalinibacter orientalis]|uniref:histidine--tRNA ligase n=1 Tax=Lentisalinibacter orientalis TaxID=2992241 RepID=UPI00386CB1BB